jgi:hypothetical protein
MSTIDINLNSICEQRRKSLLYTTPPIRYEAENIYEKFPQFTKFQFDMRRKAEILSYNPSSSNTQTNSLTKKEKYSQLIKGNNGNKGSSYQDIVINQTDVCGNIVPIVIKYPDYYSVTKVRYANDICANPLYRDVYTIIKNGRLQKKCNTDLIPTPTSSSGIPGPIMYLIKDTNVPLYNYTKKTNAYGIINSTVINPWETFTENNIIFYGSVINKLFTLTINSTISDYAYNFNVQTPLYLFFSGNPKNTLLSDTTRILTNTIEITNIIVTVFYNSSVVKLAKPVTITPATQFPIITFKVPLIKNVPKQSFEGSIYLGLLNLSNLYLYTQPGYVYDINITIVLASSSTSDPIYLSYYDDIEKGLYLNTTNNDKVTINCDISNNPAIIPNTGFSFSGL